MKKQKRHQEQKLTAIDSTKRPRIYRSRLGQQMTPESSQMQNKEQPSSSPIESESGNWDPLTHEPAPNNRRKSAPKRSAAKSRRSVIFVLREDCPLKTSVRRCISLCVVFLIAYKSETSSSLCVQSLIM